MFTGMNPRMTGEFVRPRKTFLAGGKNAGKRFLSSMGAYVSCLGIGQSGDSALGRTAKTHLMLETRKSPTAEEIRTLVWPRY